MNSEDDTFNKLKSITRDEAMAIHDKVMYQIQHEYMTNGQDAKGFPISLVRERVDPLLKPYGWSFDKLLDLRNTIFS